jgi:hypothetical protein
MPEKFLIIIFTISFLQYYWMEDTCKIFTFKAEKDMLENMIHFYNNVQFTENSIAKTNTLFLAVLGFELRTLS